MHPSSMPPTSDVLLNIVGSNVFGRDPKISSEQTFNMFVTDGWLTSFAGYKKTLVISDSQSGRAIYSSARGGFMIAVVGNIVYRIEGPANNLLVSPLFEIETFSGDVFIDENIAGQIAICDQKDLWIYSWSNPANPPQKAPLPTNPVTGLIITPGYVTFHDGYFIVPDITSSFWYLSPLNNALASWNWGAGAQPVAGAIQTKPENAVAVLRAPGRGNLIYVFGRNVVEMWNDVGAQLFPYVRTNSVSIDYGCLSPNTIATMDTYIAWLGVNEKSGPVIMVSSGSDFTRLSTDGIDFKLANLKFPEQSYGFFYKQDGHVFYQITFYNPSDNLSLVYDFNTKAFFYVTDEYMNFHIAESVAFYNNTYYFTAINSGSIYELNTDYTTYDYTLPSQATPNPNPPVIEEIPRVRICKTDRRDDTSKFIANSLSFVIEQGVDQDWQHTALAYLTTPGGVVLTTNAEPGFVGKFLTTSRTLDDYVPYIDLAISKDGGESFSGFVRKEMQRLGKRSNRVVFWRFGQANEFTVQLRFWTRGKLTVGNGVFEARVAQDR